MWCEDGTQIIAGLVNNLHSVECHQDDRTKGGNKVPTTLCRGRLKDAAGVLDETSTACWKIWAAVRIVQLVLVQNGHLVTSAKSIADRGVQGGHDDSIINAKSAWKKTVMK